MRIGEAVALKWGDIDFEGRFITRMAGNKPGQGGNTQERKKPQGGYVTAIKNDLAKI